MKSYKEYSREELEALKTELTALYEQYRTQNLKLDMSRGKPCARQLDLSDGLLTCVTAKDVFAADGTDLRNYGILDGIPEIKELMGSLVGARPEQVIVGGNASLTLMYDAIARAMTHGVLGSRRPWGEEEERKFLCPVPGYDRHFSICQHFGFQLISIPMTETGPDMDTVERLVADDASIKGIWCVPKYSNPDGCVYSDETVRRMANLHPAAPDFRIFWDNAYCIHDFDMDNPATIPNILEECEKAGNPHMVFQFASTSKITYPGAGVSIISGSKENMDFIKKQMAIQTIGYDKLNMMRHVKFFGNKEGVLAQMKKHAAHLKPRFDLVRDMFRQELGETGVAHWTEPKGGYFVAFHAMDGCAADIVRLCKEAGVVLTAAGATHPYQNDPKDSTIRIAPSYPTVEELGKAMEVFCVCVRLVSVEKLLETA